MLLHRLSYNESLIIPTYDLHADKTNHMTSIVTFRKAAGNHVIEEVTV